MGKSQRDKGARGELEVLKLLHSYGWDKTVRGFASGGQGGGDLTGGPTDLLIEVKRTETTSPWAWISQASTACRSGEWWAVFFRRNSSGWHVIVDAEKFLQLVKSAEAGNQ